jgi:4-amino-4-deoxy-L-arabinose transferase-like glycosyltransferase
MGLKSESLDYLKKTSFFSVCLALLSVLTMAAFVYGFDDQSDILDKGNIAEFFDLCSGLFAAILFGISFLAYRNTKSMQVFLVMIAFGLFALRTIISRLDLFIPEIESSILELLLAILGFIALALFFLAIVTKQRIRTPHEIQRK